MNLKLIEPLRELFKDEVRAAGESMGIPHDVLWRHPFPGPGLAVRCLGELTEERLAALREADAIVDEEVRAAADVAFATCTGGATLEAQEATRTAIKRTMEVATEAGNKKAKLERGSSPGEQRPWCC